MSEIVKYGLIGAGDRAAQLFRHLVHHQDKVILASVYDPNSQRAQQFADEFGSNQTRICSNGNEIIDDPAIPWIMDCSPNCFHREYITRAFEAGKHVFGEKPLATTIEDCIAIHNAHKASGRFFATGFVLRYSALYRKAKELIDQGVIGKVVTIEADENIPPAHGGYIMSGWRRKSEISGPHILEKCCHDLDLLNWLIDSLPVKTASFGGLNIFTPENRDHLTKFKSETGQGSIYLEWPQPTREIDDPFAGQKDIIDNQVAILEYASGARATFHTTLANAIHERRMYICGTEGTIILELYSSALRIKRIGYGQEACEQVFDFHTEGDGHGGGDRIIVEELVDSMVNGIAPRCSGKEGLYSAVVSLAIEKARVEGTVVDLREIWDRLEVSVS